MAGPYPPLAYLRMAFPDEIGMRQKYDATYGDPTAPQLGMFAPKAAGWHDLADQIRGGEISGTRQQVTPTEYDNLYAEHANAQRSALAALGFDAKRTMPAPDAVVKDFPWLGAYTPKTDQMFVNSYTDGRPQVTGSHEGMHRGIDRLRVEGLLPPPPGMDVADPDAHETLVRAMMIDRYGPEAEGFTGTGNFNDQQIQRGLDWLAQNSGYARRVEAAAAQLIAKQRPRGPR